MMEKPQEHFSQFRQNSSVRKKTVLLIDDSQDLLDVNKTILEIDDYEVLTALCGKEALSILSAENPPDLIVLDFCLEDMSGPDFLLELEKALPAIIESVPVVFLTGMYDVPATKAVGKIMKPTGIDNFLAAVQHYIEVGVDRLRYN